jgi:hypothetical protein
VPIRTNRGRAAVYRRLWGWPMRSPRHLVVTMVVVGVLVITVGLIVPKLTGSKGSPGANASFGGESTSAAPAPGQPGSGSTGGGPAASRPTGSASASTLPTRITSPPQTPTSAAPAPKALETAILWAKAWVTHPQGTTSEQWLNGMRPYTTEEQLAIMATVDPANVPATEVTGQATATTSYTTSVEASVPTNGGPISITVISTPQGWKVAHYEKAA